MSTQTQETTLLRSKKWRIMSVSIFVTMLDYGFLYALGTMFVPMLDTFGENRGTTASVQSIYNGVTFISSTITGLVISKWGPGCGILAGSILIPVGFFLSFFAKTVVHLYVSIGIIGGLGNSFVFVSSVVAVGQSFPESQRPVALSIQMACMGLASILYPYFLDWLLSIYGLNGTFLLLSGLYLHTFIAAIVYRFEIGTMSKEGDAESSKRIKNGRRSKTIDTNPDDLSDDARDKQDDTDKRGEGYDDETDSTISLCSATFYLFAAASSLLIGNITGFITIAQDLFVAKGLSISESLTGFLVFNICSAFSRLAPGLAAKLNLSCFSTSLLASLLGLAGQLLILFTDSFIFLMIGSGLSGAALGGYASSVVTATFELLGSSRQAVGFGIIVTINGISVSGVGPIFGAMRDASGHYKSVLIITSSLNAVCFVFICTVLVTTHLHRERMKRRSR